MHNHNPDAQQSGSLSELYMPARRAQISSSQMATGQSSLDGSSIQTLSEATKCIHAAAEELASALSNLSQLLEPLRDIAPSPVADKGPVSGPPLIADLKNALSKIQVQTQYLYQLNRELRI